MNPKSMITLVVWLAVLGAVILVATRVVTAAARKAEGAL